MSYVCVCVWVTARELQIFAPQCQLLSPNPSTADAMNLPKSPAAANPDAAPRSVCGFHALRVSLTREQLGTRAICLCLLFNLDESRSAENDCSDDSVRDPKDVAPKFSHLRSARRPCAAGEKLARRTIKLTLDLRLVSWHPINALPWLSQHTL